MTGAVALVDLGVWLVAVSPPNTTTRWGGSLGVLVVVAIILLGFVPTGWRVGRPRLVFGLVWAFSVLAGTVLVGYQPFGALLLGLYSVARRSPAGVAGLALAACAVPLGVNSYNSSVLMDRPAGFLPALGLWAAVAAAVWGLGRLGRLTQERSEQRERELAAEAAAELRSERLRLARELHDIVAHSVSAMILQAAGTRAVVDQGADARVRQSLEAIEGSGVQAMRELHRLLGLLRAVDDRADQALTGPESTASLADLRALVETARRCGVDVEVSSEGRSRSLDSSVDHAAYRLLQEALTNVIKHGGRGATARIQVLWRASTVELTVRSSAGHAPGRAELSGLGLSAGLGLRGLAERITLVGGSFEAGPLRAGAFRVHATLPTLEDIVDTSGPE